MKFANSQGLRDLATSASMAASLFIGMGCEPSTSESAPTRHPAQRVNSGVDLDREPVVSQDATHWRGYPAKVASLLPKLPILKDGLPIELAPSQYTALIFLNPNCPLAARYMPKLNELQHKYGVELDIKFLAVFSGLEEQKGEIAAFSAKYEPVFSSVMDHDAALADALHAERSPEVFLLNRAFEIVYRGAIDDNQRVRGANPVIRNDFLKEVLQDLVDGNATALSVTDAEGCYLERPTLDSIYPSWERDIGPLVEKNCAGCHSQGEIAANFPLTTAEEVQRSIRTLNERIEDGTMPPWRAAGPKGIFEHDRRLDPMEIWAFKAWEKLNTPVSDVAFTIDPKKYADARHIDNPDMVVEMLNPDGESPWYTLPAEGIIPYQTFIAPTVFDQDRWLTASEVVTTAPQSLHHISVFVIPPDDKTASEPMAKSRLARMYAARKLGILPAEYEEVYRFYGPNLTRAINLAGFYAPGEGYMELSPERGVLIPKGSQLAFECHYVSTGVEVRDRSAIKLKFGELPENAKDARVIVRTGAPRILQLQIEPNQERTITKTMPIFADAEIRGIRPHMHLRGKEYTCELEYPDGSRSTVIHIPEWDLNWERFYVPIVPIKLPAGSKLHFTYTWDNTSTNLNNPKPDEKVTFGTQLHNEMGLSWLSMVYSDPAQTEEAELKLQEALDDPDYGKER